MKKKRVVVTGLGVVSSIGIGKDVFWDNLIKGKSGISLVESFDTTNQFTHFGGEIKDFNCESFMSKNKIKLMGRASRLAIAAAKLALDDAKLNANRLGSLRIAICIGTTGGEAQEIEEMDIIWTKHGHDKVEKWSIMQYPVNNISSSMAIELKTKGINRIFTTACAAGNYGIGYGFDLLQLDKADLVIVGGSDAFSYLSFTGFNQVRAVAPEKCQPFDKNRKGMIVGEGAGMLILETLESALKRNALIYAEILGYGLSCDAFHMTNPQVEGIVDCMINTLKESDLTPDDVDYISAHGTGTKHNDRVESAAIKKVFNGRKVAVSAIKSMLGHTMGAASAISAIVCCLSVENNVIAPTINFETPDPECDIDCVPNAARKQRVDVALNNGFAFGGNNSSLAIKKYKRR
ncbi:MAG: beta-ketoacyl-[acyl-carrier-protein] synthase family protein [Candidatus Omnitrophica bacterium]|nr:beta-ketoacyl-[acyl-carrier-protein] synthase family protein [Candidatus Omnitrophota bacterium]